MNPEDRKVIDQASKEYLQGIGSRKADHLLRMAELSAIFGTPTTIFLETIKESGISTETYEGLAASVIASIITEAANNTDEAMRIVNKARERIIEYDKELTKR